MNYIADYRGRTDLISNYGSNSLLLYALQLRFDLSDIASVASESLTDGSNDKKCDLIYVDQDTGIAVVAQAYQKQNPKDTDLAPSNKASDLNTAAAWVFSQQPEDVPEEIREQVQLLQNSINGHSIRTIYFWYVHNLNERNGQVIKNELAAMQTTAPQHRQLPFHSALQHHVPEQNYPHGVHQSNPCTVPVRKVSESSSVRFSE